MFSNSPNHSSFPNHHIRGSWDFSERHIIGNFSNCDGSQKLTFPNTSAARTSSLLNIQARDRGAHPHFPNSHNHTTPTDHTKSAFF